MTRYYLDTEFSERGPGYHIDLISIGIVSSDGREYYSQSCEFNIYDTNDWVKANVLPSLVLCPHTNQGEGKKDTVSALRRQMAGHGFVGGQCWSFRRRPHRLDDCPWRRYEDIREDILAFLAPEKYGRPEIWTWYGAYDHVVFCQLFGTMADLPKGFPMYTRDLKMWADLVGNPRLPEQTEGHHNALEDARHNRVRYDFLREYTHRNLARINFAA